VLTHHAHANTHRRFIFFIVKLPIKKTKRPEAHARVA
jgi:hypothetical protein